MNSPDYARVLRVRELARLLRAANPWNAVTAAERLGVNARTIKRDVDFLRSLGYEVEWVEADKSYALRRRPRAIL